MKSWSENINDELPWIAMAVNCLELYVNEINVDVDNGESDARHVKFIIEQLNLLQCNKYSRRYSTSLLVFSYVLHSTSASAYRNISE